MAEGHSFRIRESRWKQVEKKAWELSKEADRLIKPTDIADATIWLYTREITLEDIENAKKSRKE